MQEEVEEGNDNESKDYSEEDQEEKNKRRYEEVKKEAKCNNTLSTTPNPKRSLWKGVGKDHKIQRNREITVRICI